MPLCISRCKLNQQNSEPVQSRLHTLHNQSHFGLRNDGAWFRFSCWQVRRHQTSLGTASCRCCCCGVWHRQPRYRFLESWRAQQGGRQRANARAWESAAQLAYVELHPPAKEILVSSKRITKNWMLLTSRRIRHQHPTACLRGLALLRSGEGKWGSCVAVWSPSRILRTWYLYPGSVKAPAKMWLFQKDKTRSVEISRRTVVTRKGRGRKPGHRQVADEGRQPSEARAARRVSPKGLPCLLRQKAQLFQKLE